jgi:Terminase large subunit, T4likevirus-type, N-terminal/Terminase RNaseH-like domain
MVDIALTKPQRAFVFNKSQHPAIVGGLGSGKTSAGTMRIILLLLEDKGADGGYYLPTYDLIKLRGMVGVEEDLERIGIGYTTNKSEYSIQLDGGYGKIIFRSYDNPNRIIAYEVAHSICDELDTLPKDKAEIVWRKITERNRQKRNKPNTIGLVTTPDQGVNGFVYDKWGKNPKKGYELIKAKTSSNPYLPEGYAEQILANYDPILANLYMDGEFVSLTRNKVYHFFDRFKHHTDRTIVQGDYLHIGLDFNIGGCCATVFVIQANNPIGVDEFSSHDTQDFINNLARYTGHSINIYPDSSGKAGRTNASQSDISMIRSAGYTCLYKESNPAIRDRVNAYNALLAHGRLMINTDKCPELVNALEIQGYDKNGDPEKFDSHPAIDDWLDGSGYFIAYKFPIIKPIQLLQLAGH